MTKHSDVLDIPMYYKNIHKEILSDNIINILQTDPLEYMRELFIRDNKMFYNLRDELILRGIGFKKGFHNSYLLKRDYQINFILYKVQNTNAFEKIDFSMYGSSNFVERFNIETDLFFHNVPWEGLLRFLPHGSPELLQSEFERNGFVLEDIDNYNATPLIKENELTIDGHIFNRPRNEIIKSTYNYEKIYQPFECYYDITRYRDFINFCIKNGVFKISYINS